MKTEKNILIAFILNLAFSIFEFVGGVVTGSVAIASDALHDFGDAVSIGFAFLFEKKSKRQPDEKFTYGYARFSVVGSALTTSILIIGTLFVIYNASNRLINPVAINYNGMLVFAIFGLCVNFFAAIITGGGHSLNEKAVNLHMLEDVLGWLVVLIGAVVIKFTGLIFIDAVMSICVALFILVNAVKNLKKVFEVFLEKVPNEIDVAQFKNYLCEVEGVLDVHHIHVWSIDGNNNCATLHVVAQGDIIEIKKQLREEAEKLGINHLTIEFEKEGEICCAPVCRIENSKKCSHHHLH